MIYTFPSDTYMQNIYQKKLDAISFDNNYRIHTKYKKICIEADIDYLEENKMTIDINLLCLMNEYLNNLLQKLIYTKLYEFNNYTNKYTYHYSYEVKQRIKQIKKCIKYIKKIK